MISFQSALFAALSWNVTPIVTLDNNWPIRCGIHYFDEKKNISFKVEKFVRATRVWTAMTLKFPVTYLLGKSKTRTINTETIFQIQPKRKKPLCRENLEHRTGGFNVRNSKFWGRVDLQNK